MIKLFKQTGFLTVPGVLDSPSLLSGLLPDVLHLREEAKAHQHEEASPSGPVLSLQRNEAVLRRHLQLQIHRVKRRRVRPVTSSMRRALTNGSWCLQTDSPSGCISTSVDYLMCLL